MNERFESLAEEAMVHIPGQTGLHTRAFSLEKFAEVIVRECMEQVWYTREDSINGNISEVIKERMSNHFGIE